VSVAVKPTIEIWFLQIIYINIAKGNHEKRTMQQKQMHESTHVSPRVFTAIQNVDITELSLCSHKDIRPILPCLVRMSLISPLDITKECVEGRKQVLTILSGIESVNSIIALLSIDFHALETDVRQEQQLRLAFSYVLIIC